MKTTLPLLAVILGSILITTTLVGQSPSGNIHGWVHDKKTCLPIPSVKIEALAEGKVIMSTLTDSSGKFLLPIEQTCLVTLQTSIETHGSNQVDRIIAVGHNAHVYFALERDLPKMSLLTTGPELNGTLEGLVLDEKTAEPVPFANVAIYQGSQLIAGGISDIGGKYSISVPAGIYSIKTSVIGYSPEEASEIIIKEKRKLLLDFKLRTGIVLPEVVINEYTSPLIEKDGGCLCGGFRRTRGVGIEKMPARCCGFVETAIIEDSLEVEEPEPILAELKIELYPNPASSHITLDVTGIDDNLVAIRILDSNGRIVLEQSSVQPMKHVIPLEQLSNGVYFLTVSSRDKLLTERFIVAR